MFEPEVGQLDPDNSEEIAILLDATGLLDGLYEGTLTFFSNDPADPMAVVVIEINVSGSAIATGDPLPMPYEGAEPLADFGEVFVNGQTSTMVEIINEGSLAYEIDAIEASDHFGTDIQAGQVVEARGSITATIFYMPTEAGEHAGEVWFMTDANLPEETEGDIGWEVSGHSVVGPTISVDHDALSANAAVDGDPVVSTMVISNADGERANLEFKIKKSEVEEEEEERDQVRRGVRNISPVRELANANININTRSRMPNSQDGEAVEAYMRENPLGDDEAPRRDPLPDDPPGSVYALVTQANPWGYDLNRVFNQVDGLEWERVQQVDEDFDYDAFDCIWFGNYNSDGWTNNYNDNLEAIEDWVDGGGLIT
jgi:hypothetical protein